MVAQSHKAVKQILDLRVIGLLNGILAAHRESEDDVDPALFSTVFNPMTGVILRQITVEDVERHKEEFAEAVKRVL